MINESFSKSFIWGILAHILLMTGNLHILKKKKKKVKLNQEKAGIGNLAPNIKSWPIPDRNTQAIQSALTQVTVGRSS